MSVEWSSPTVIYAIYFTTIIASISVVTTLLAILVFFYSSIIRKDYQNLLLLNLLIIELIYSVNTIFFYSQMSIMNNAYILSLEWACSLQSFMSLFCCGMEIYTLMCIALERYFAILKQQPLTYNQIIGLLVFGYIWEAFTASFPLWNSSFYYAISDAKTYCGYSYKDRSQLLPALCAALHISTCISIISYCYLEIFRYYKDLKKNAHNNSMSIVSTNTKKKEANEELRILWTTIRLVGWTFLGWTPMLVLVTYQIITGNAANPYWDIIGSLMILISFCGDSIILLLYDNRWRNCLKDMNLRIRKAFK